MLRVEYSKDGDAAYIYLTSIAAGQVARTALIDPADSAESIIGIDFDSNGMMLGIEVLDASRRLPASLLESASKPGSP
ncbi:MAG: DUF2283 domain-containing protein [Chloroflexi bacterium]|nr:DUF2283 domain-containing protein [Chloroflexota bacterium]